VTFAGARPRSSGRRPEVWGGIECTVARVGERVVDQMHLSGHDVREDDLDRVASLGVAALRCLVSWERIAPGALDDADWSWTDRRLAHMRALGLRPIAGLVHHGSGPHGTSLVEDSFVEGLARFAGAAAARYPWVDDWTPVNEPLTTARFSGLYGHWHPHCKDDATFARALVVQCRAVAAAMAAIRRVNPRARLVQTEDLGRCFATPDLADRATFENERRWASLDLLCGRLAPGDVMWEYLRRATIDEDDLDWFRAHPCPPDIIGVNHYLNSERLLDSRQERYPLWTRGDAAHPYADADAVRACPPEAVGPYARLWEAWERYKLPLAVTEAQHCSTREEQMRWLLEVWEAIGALADEGVDVRAMTVWSLFGAYDWNSLLTREDGFYEPGAFDVRGETPRETAVAGLVRELAAGVAPSHPVLAMPGWWRRPGRALYGTVDVQLGAGAVPATRRVPVLEKLTLARPVPLLILGAETPLGAVVKEACSLRGLPYRTVDGENDALKDLLDDGRPWAIVDARDRAANADAATPRRLPRAVAHTTSSASSASMPEAAATSTPSSTADLEKAVTIDDAPFVRHASTDLLNMSPLPLLVFSTTPLVGSGAEAGADAARDAASSAEQQTSRARGADSRGRDAGADDVGRDADDANRDVDDVGRDAGADGALAAAPVLIVDGAPVYTGVEAPGLLFLRPTGPDDRTRAAEPVNAAALVSLALDLLIDGVRGHWSLARATTPQP